MGHWCKPENGMLVEIFAFRIEDAPPKPGFGYRYNVMGMNVVGNWIELMESINLSNVREVHNYLENNITNNDNVIYFKDLRMLERH